MTICLFPRLDQLAVAQCLEDIDGLIREAGRPLTEDRLPDGTGWTAIGGAQISLARLDDLRSIILDAALQCGFPERGAVADRARFDAVATVALAGFEPLASGEADRDDVWAFIATVLAPDVVAWRFINRGAHRFEGGVRNTFQRLWMRAWALDREVSAGAERWSLVAALTEDALVQLTERPSVGADRRLSLAIATAWADTSAQVGLSPMQEIMRRAMIDLRIRNEIQMLGAISDADLDLHVGRVFARAAGLDVEAEPDTLLLHPGMQLDPVSPNGAIGEEVGGQEAGGVGSDSKTGELEIQHAILRLLLDGGIWSNADLKARLAAILPLTDADRGKGARPAEELWENRVNNALGRARSSSLYAKGFVENRGHGLHAVTEAGTKYLNGADEASSSDDPVRE